MNENEIKKKNPHAVHLGRLGGLTKTPAKQHAARENGKLGGRPPKSLRTRTRKDF